MTKRIITILALVFLFMLPFSAYADVVMGNDFFYENKDKTEPVDLTFTVDSPSGKISAKEKPGSSREVYSLENGSVVSIKAVYNHKGEYWGIPPESHSNLAWGWLPMDQLLTWYSKNDFLDEHLDEFYDYDGDFDILCNAGDYYIWQWPGTDRGNAHYFVDDYDGLDDPEAYRARYAWLDGEGREWLYTIIFDGGGGGLARFGSTDGWICISDPQNGQIPAFNPAPEPAPWSPPDGSAIAGPGNSGSGIPLLLLIVIIAAALAVVMILVLRRKKAKA
ncbi:MAG: hypothetical protein FWG03_03920 [Clostridiales bacterium]|nr:hypothetical protein [Clostridiales bacterium]